MKLRFKREELIRMKGSRSFYIVNELKEHGAPIVINRKRKNDCSDYMGSEYSLGKIKQVMDNSGDIIYEWDENETNN